MPLTPKQLKQSQRAIFSKDGDLAGSAVLLEMANHPQQRADACDPITQLFTKSLTLYKITGKNQTLAKNI